MMDVAGMRYMNANKTEVAPNLFPLMTLRLISLLIHGQSAIAHLRDNLRTRVSEISQT